MSKILLQTTIAEHPDDWDITRFSLLADELRAAGHEVIVHNRVNRGSAAKAALEALTRT